MFASSRLFIPLTFVVSLLAAGCDGPCTNLAEMICACEPNDVLERACLLNVERATRDPIEGEDAQCEELMKTCTCDALERNDFEACGLTLDGESS